MHLGSLKCHRVLRATTQTQESPNIYTYLSLKLNSPYVLVGMMGEPKVSGYLSVYDFGVGTPFLKR
ncbi:hypothetical protein VCRA2126O85_10104 [Vibrio crassostreae]|nr:hypothetical protein VCRA2128O100_10104 [Vibrio crassostreae]CAK2696617.1 hypothetical protein VCRA2128O106_10104 [Vibrio crassostreae]CAK2697572.1 hypothetical protein VCRA2125O83_10104 [Vibrio crassostreae]CAK2700868.1 hypothetical protein VCRA2126O86_10104 [Vibrio crassostreae]CAK2704269.1 hypothetical protein VCRA2126O85_10104 [Vibrio crassostreae]